MARVYNDVILVHLHGDASVKQYSGTGPLVVALQGERGETRALSGDYVIYQGEIAVGVVQQSFLDPLREEDEPLDPVTPVPTGAHCEATLLDNAGAPLKGEYAILKQGGVPLSQGRTDDTGLVIFNVLPGTYQVGPKDPARGPEVTVEAALEEPEVEPPVTRQSQGTSGSGPSRFDVMGNPDPNGKYDANGQLLQ
jgi:hypothetical protein